jgi:hypothetical protein
MTQSATNNENSEFVCNAIGVLPEFLQKSCEQDVNLLRKLCDTSNFKNTLNLYNKLIELSSRLSFKPDALNAYDSYNQVTIILPITIVRSRVSAFSIVARLLYVMWLFLFFFLLQT